VCSRDLTVLLADPELLPGAVYQYPVRLSTAFDQHESCMSNAACDAGPTFILLEKIEVEFKFLRIDQAAQCSKTLYPGLRRLINLLNTIVDYG
jgi:hypothetical protein